MVASGPDSSIAPRFAGGGPEGELRRAAVAPLADVAAEVSSRHSRPGVERRPAPAAPGGWSADCPGRDHGVSLAGYWLWLGPLWAGPVTLPTVARPAGVLTALGPLVVRSSPAAAVALPQALQVETQAAASPPASNASQQAGQWTIQTGVFTSAARAAMVVDQLTAIGYPAFQREQTFLTRGRFTVAFAGPMPADRRPRRLSRRCGECRASRTHTYAS